MNDRITIPDNCWPPGVNYGFRANLRDLYAGIAMHGILTGQIIDVDAAQDPEGLAARSFRIADAMIAEGNRAR